MSNHLQSFLFDNTDIRGAIVQLDDSFAQLIQEQNYGEGQKQLLAEFAVANLLMSSHIKFDGLLSLQARGNNRLELVLAECTNELHFRGIIRSDADIDGQDFQQLFDGGALAITIEPTDGQRYQGVVPLEENSLSACLAQYFQQSEQIRTWFFLAYQQGKVAGLMLQALPCSQPDREQYEEDWLRITHLASTLTPDELIDLPPEQVLYRLFHEEQVRIFEPRTAKFQCSCSKERIERALISLGKDELMDILQEEGNVSTQCHFCNQEYRFERSEILQLLQSGSTH